MTARTGIGPDEPPLPEPAAALASFVDASPSPYHAVANAAELLLASGFREVRAADAWPAGGGSWFLRGAGSLAAWVEAPTVPAHHPFRLIGAHTDSPNLRVRPRPDTGRAGWRQLGVDVYGGALVNSWLDRDLGLSGRVAVRGTHGTETRLLVAHRPLLRVPQLAIHLDRDVTDKGLLLNRQQHVVPVWGTGAPDEGGFARFLAAELDVEPAAVVAWDVMAHDLTPSRPLGVDATLLAAPRLDNLCSTFAAIRSLIAAAGTDARHTRLVVLFDHEEVGSESREGAAGPFLATVIERVVAARGGGRDDLHRATAASVCVSADMAHATHPNYAERHEPNHVVAVNGGPVLKVNVNQRYATDAHGAGVFAAACERAGVPLQRYVVRGDLPCGSTIGPITAARLGMTVVDVGAPQLSMHSARELCGVEDPGMLEAALGAFLTA